MQHRVIKNGDLFLTSDASGDIRPGSAHGLYMSDTRFLSRMELTINGKRPMLLFSAADENVLARIRLTNEHDESDGRVRLWRETVEIVRERFIHGGVLYETIRMKNFATKPVAFELGMAFDADFRDMFQVRGFKPADPLGQVTERKAEETRWHAVYTGADGCRRETVIAWDVKADAVSEQGELAFTIRLAPGEEREIRFTVAPSLDGQRPVVQPQEEALAEVRRINVRWRERCAGAESDCDILNRVFERGALDLRTLLTDYGHGPIPVAGIPWFAVPFGRDSLITALLALPLQPEIARVTLRAMAEWQGTADDPWKDEQPGKIMHELRRGELSRLNLVPFAPYYGSIDSTPLFLLLAAEYAHWTGDTETIAELMPAVERALEWIDRFGDRDGDGFVEYLKESDGGLVNQGWKDSGDAIIHRDGEFARAPIALIEVQGYVYQAKTRLADVLDRLGRREWANRLRAEAAQLRQRVESVFWMPEEDFYAIALDAGKRQVESVTSNPGHLLMTGLPDPERAKRVARRLVSEDLFGGYGIRTMSSRSTGYNPMSYHNGSVWPHDNAIILLGMSRLGMKEEARTVMSGLLRAAAHFEYGRLPELFCGYDVSSGPPVPYPVACSPQAWAAATSVALVRVMLGLEPAALDGVIRLDPSLPPEVGRLTVRNVPVAGGRLSVEVWRESDRAPLQIRVLESPGGCRVEIAGTPQDSSVELNGSQTV